MLDHAQSSSVRRIVVRAALVLAAVVALAAAAPRVLDRLRPDPADRSSFDRPPSEAERWASRRADARLAEAESSAWGQSTTIAPRDAAVDASGERVRWFQGFGVSVESVPAGATVRVNGAERGETPLTASVECKPGERVRVEIRKQGFTPQQRTTRCRQDQLVELSVELR